MTPEAEAPLLRGVIFPPGQAAVILVEGLIVMIRFTRPILFELFIRFPSFQRRIHKPLERPDRAAGARGCAHPEHRYGQTIPN